MRFQKTTPTNKTNQHPKKKNQLYMDHRKGKREKRKKNCKKKEKIRDYITTFNTLWPPYQKRENTMENICVFQ